MGLINQLQKEFDNRNTQFRIIGKDLISRIQREIQDNQDCHRGKADYNNYADITFDFDILADPTVKSIFVLATPSPFYIFRIEGYPDLILPPTYGDKNSNLKEINQITKDLFSQYGYNTYPVHLPKKLTAVRSGLAKYGRNAITYVEGMGSYVNLTLFASDYPYGLKTPMNDDILMAACNKCGACIKKCPTKALDKDNVWLNFNFCMTEMNESEGVFPDWLKDEYHNCLMGCLSCQEVCPQNKGKENKIVVPVTQKFINEIMIKKDFVDVDEEIRDILEEHNIHIYFDVLKRNIEFLWKNKM